MMRVPSTILWAAATILVVVTATRIATAPDPYAAGAAAPIEDRREHRFRDYTWSQAERLLLALAAEVEAADDATKRARALARIASLQRERGFAAQAEAAAREALRLAPADAETRRLLGTPIQAPPASHL